MIKKNHLPGIGLALLIALIATMIEGVLPGNIIGPSVIAMFIGIIVRATFFNRQLFQEGVQFTSKRVLKLAIILLGASLNFSIVLEVGGQTVAVLVFTLLTAFLGGYILGKLFKVNWKLSGLISAGTAICGGSAIASVAPVIEADDGDVSYAMSLVFLVDLFLVVLYPLIGRMMSLSDSFFGYWAGTSINDTSSVVAASFSFSEAAGEIATLVKLTRTLAIIPTVLIFSSIYIYKQRSHVGNKAEKVKVSSLVPWFIVFFVLMAVLQTIGFIPQSVADIMRSISRFLMVTALASIGLKTDVKALMKTGIKPLLLGVTLSALVVIVSYIAVSIVIA